MPEDILELTHSDIEEAISEMAALTGLPYGDLLGAARELAGGERDVGSLAYGVAALTAELEGRGVSLAPESTEAYLSVSQAERDQAHEAGNSLPDKSYPINNAKQLRSAAILAASHHGNWQAARRLIIKRAKELGVSLDSLPGFGSSDSDNDGDNDNDVAASMVGEYTAKYGPQSYYNHTGAPVGSAEGATIALTDTTGDDLRWDQTNDVDAYLLCVAADSDAASKMFGLARSDNLPVHAGPPGTGDANDIAARNPHLFGSRSGTPHAMDTTVPGGYGHSPSCPPGCDRDHLQPARGGEVHPEVERLLDVWASKMGNREKPGPQSSSHPPLSPAERERASRRARPGHTSYR
jgi:hypothetical protein